ncbi:hypothetical protein [Parahaliea aestuarii]|uniref:Uncharacterized protein n=1 Tax=Parahaliea aestuarii TaxID=1852021 RepID=A0A5C8ZPA7_9GAMM|nr:hypothetical protein [Parahaliea aestuarii]TXS89211.1 hypothetical protein FVW59_19000 [Parahaliea aestuarii]
MTDRHSVSPGRPIDWTSPQDLLTQYVSLLRIQRSDLPFIPNVISCLLKSLSERDRYRYHWVPAALFGQLSNELETINEYLRSENRLPILPASMRGNPVHGYISEEPLAALVCHDNSEWSEVIKAVRVMVLVYVVRAKDSSEVLSTNLLRELRLSFPKQNNRPLFELIRREISDPAFLITLHSQLLETPSLRGVDESVKKGLTKLTERLIEIVRSEGGIDASGAHDAGDPTRQLTEGLGTPPAPLSRQSRGESPGRASGAGGATDTRPVRPPSRVAVQNELEEGAAHQVIALPQEDRYGEPRWTFYVAESDREAASTSDLSELAARSAASRYWLRTLSHSAPSNRLVRNRLERQRFLAFIHDYLAGDNDRLKGCALAHLVAYLTPVSAKAFLFDPDIYKRVFDDDGRFRVNTVQVERKAVHSLNANGPVRGLLEMVVLAMPEQYTAIIGRLKALPINSFAEGFALDEASYVLAKKTFFRHLSDGGRYPFKPANLNKQLQFALQQVGDNTAATYTLAGRSNELYPVLFHYWRASEQTLKTLYADAVDRLLAE